LNKKLGCNPGIGKKVNGSEKRVKCPDFMPGAGRKEQVGH
jgi:hypothetical protein